MIKKLIVLSFIILCGLSSFTQNIPYFPVNPTQYGNRFNRVEPVYVLHTPEKDTLLTNTADTTAQIFYNRSDSSFWGYSKSKGFFKIGTGNGSDLASYHTSSQLTDTSWSINRPNSTKTVVILEGDTTGSGTGSGVQSVSGLNTDNTDPVNPVVKISVDGTTITGDGTPANPLVSHASGGGSYQLPYNGNSTDYLGGDTLYHALPVQINSDWNSVSGVSQILNKPTLFSGSYTDLTNKPSIPAQFNPIAGSNITISGTYPNITFNAAGGGTGSGDSIISYTKNSTKDSSILLLNDGRRFAVKDSIGVGGSTPSLQQVTSVHNVTTDPVLSTQGFFAEDTTAAGRGIQIVSGNGAVQSLTTGGNSALYYFYNGYGRGSLRADSVSVVANNYVGKVWQLPNASGIIPLTVNKVAPNISGNISTPSGTATLASGTVTVSTTSIHTGDLVFVSYNTPSGTQGFLSVPGSLIVNGSSFKINSSSSSDNSTVNWQIINK